MHLGTNLFVNIQSPTKSHDLTIFSIQQDSKQQQRPDIQQLHASSSNVSVQFHPIRRHPFLLRKTSQNNIMRATDQTGKATKTDQRHCCRATTLPSDQPAPLEKLRLLSHEAGGGLMMMMLAELRILFLPILPWPPGSVTRHL